MHAHVLSHVPDDRAPSPPERVAAAVLVAVMAVGSLLIWIGIPAASLWLWSQLSHHYTTVYAAALIGSPLTMAGCAWLLHRVNRVYLRVSRTPDVRPGHTAWLKSASGSRRREPRGVLEVCMTVSVVLALVTFAVWLVFFTGGGYGGGFM
jgi:hypothetical protein